MSGRDGHLLRQLVATSRCAGLVLAVLEDRDGGLANFEMVVDLKRRRCYALLWRAMLCRHGTRAGARLLLRGQTLDFIIIILPLFVPYKGVLIFIVRLAEYCPSLRPGL